MATSAEMVHSTSIQAAALLLISRLWLQACEQRRDVWSKVYLGVLGDGLIPVEKGSGY